MKVCRVNCQLYEQRNLKHNSGISYETVEEIIKKKHASSSGSAVHDSNNSNDVYTPVTSAVLHLCSHTGPYNRYLQTAYRSMSTDSCSSDTKFPLRELFHVFLLTLNLLVPTTVGARINP